MTIKGLGLDLIETIRFKSFKNKNAVFLKKVFNDQELKYCFSFRDPAPHLSGIFAAKEAVVKALGAKNVSVLDIEVRHDKRGKPEVFIKNKLRKDMLISISHMEKIACAVAIHKA